MADRCRDNKKPADVAPPVFWGVHRKSPAMGVAVPRGRATGTETELRIEVASAGVADGAVREIMAGGCTDRGLHVIAGRHPDFLVNGMAATVMAHHACHVEATALVVGTGRGWGEGTEGEDASKPCKKKLRFHLIVVLILKRDAAGPELPRLSPVASTSHQTRPMSGYSGGFKNSQTPCL